MESRNTQTIAYQSNFDSFAAYDRSDELTQQRLNALLSINAQTSREKSLYRSDREKTEAELMKNPLSTKQTFAWFGLLLGTFTPAAIMIRFFMTSGGFSSSDLWILGVVAIINVISAVVGYFSGRLIGKIVSELEKKSWLSMILVLPFVGILWGMLSGGAGGIIVFIIGAFFGALLGSTVGSVALPAFTIFHRLLKKGDMIERKQFLPLAFGITFIICGFILGL